MALFADRMAQGNLGNDSATMVKLMWPQIVESKIQAWHDSVISSRTGLSPAQVDSAYNAGDIKLFQHILDNASSPRQLDFAILRGRCPRLTYQASRELRRTAPRMCDRHDFQQPGPTVLTPQQRPRLTAARQCALDIAGSVAQHQGARKGGQRHPEPLLLVQYAFQPLNG